MKTKIAVLIVSIIYCGYLLILLAASHYKSNILNPLNSEYCFKSGLLDKAIELEPSKAEYHMYYGLELLESLPRDRTSLLNQLLLAKSEFYRALRLKYYNELYAEVYNTYSTWIDNQVLQNSSLSF